MRLISNWNRSRLFAEDRFRLRPPLLSDDRAGEWVPLPLVVPKTDYRVHNTNQ